MGHADDLPPDIRADAVSATLQHQNGFRILILTVLAWDVIKFTASIEGGPEEYHELDAGTEVSKLETEFFLPAVSGRRYSFSAKGCAKAIDGSTNYCSPASHPLSKIASMNTTSLRTFLQISGVDLTKEVRLASLIDLTQATIHLRELMEIP